MCHLLRLLKEDFKVQVKERKKKIKETMQELGTVCKHLFDVPLNVCNLVF